MRTCRIHNPNLRKYDFLERESSVLTKERSLDARSCGWMVCETVHELERFDLPGDLSSESIPEFHQY
jgi:hypothetical protein